MTDQNSTDPVSIPPAAPLPAGSNATRLLQAAAIAVVVFGIEWRMADPYAIALDPQLWPLPYSMLFMMLPVALGAWAFEATSNGKPGFRVDALRGILAGTLSYVALSVFVRFF
ncbi:MAG: hypothetical protein ACI8TX_002557 [Hyphomicrobiaceae bacterium]